MKLQYILFFINLISINCFINNNLYKIKISNNNIIKKHIFLNENIQNDVTIINNNIDYNSNYNNLFKKNNIIKKLKGFLKIIRSNNILPTFVLCLFGGWINNPSITNLLSSQQFIVSTITTLLIMSSSMIINDIYDIEVDKINNSNRPLITGEVSVKEAILYAFFLLSFTEFLSLNYLKNNLQWIIHLVILLINIYTPILKKILFIKNIFCASLVSFSIFFTGLSVTNSELIKNSNFSIALNLLFFGSLSNEIILDIRDYDGDKNQNINTIPIIFGKYKAWIFINVLQYFSLIYNSFIFFYLFNNKISFYYILIMIPRLTYLYYIKKDNYSKDSISKYMKETNKTLLLLLSYLVFLPIFIMF